MTLGMLFLTFSFFCHERIDQAAGRPVMSPLTTGVLYGAATLAVMFSGVPTAFALGIVAVAFM